MEKTDFLDLVKGSISKFQLRRDGTIYNTTSIPGAPFSGSTHSSNYVELLKHTTGLDAFIIELFYTSGGLKCCAHIGPILVNNNLGKPYFEKYVSTSPPSTNLNDRDTVTIPIIEFTTDEFAELKTFFETEFQNRKKVYADELIESKKRLLENWKKETIKK